MIRGTTVMAAVLAVALMGQVTASSIKLQSSPVVIATQGSRTRSYNPGLQGAVRDNEWVQSAAASDDPPSVFVTSLNVTMIGWKMLTLNRRTIHAYQGIRYGKADRFKYSKRATPDMEDGQAEIVMDSIGDKCSQKSMLGHFATGSEDCLFLNVYVPEREDATEKLPVMFFIHGGAFINGDASLYMPTRLLDQDVILVTIHYRLGSLGWFSLQNNDAPGNAGLSDQLVALRWVKENIADFGGDPSLVTIFGQSAGSVSVSMIQTVADPKDKLFSGVIAESGSALDYWAIDNDPLASAKTFARICNCPDTEDVEAIYACVATLTHQELTMCTYDMVEVQRNNAHMGFEGCSPVVQSQEMTTRPLIKKLPSQYIEDGDAVDVPLIMGANRDEGSFVLGIMYLQYLLPNNLVNNGSYLQNEAIRDLLEAFGINDQTHSLSQALEEQYFPGVDLTSFEEMTPGMIDLSGMLLLKSGTYETALMHNRYYKKDTFFYSFDFVSDNSMFDLMFSGNYTIPFEAGVTHADELMYLFSMPSQLTEEQLLTSQRMVKLWTNFAKYRNPTPEEDKSYTDLNIPVWPKLDMESRKYLLMQDEMTAEVNYPDRWTIQMDMATVIESTTTTESGVPQDEFDQVKKQRDDYLITMIVFIVLFCVAVGVSGYFYLKSR